MRVEQPSLRPQEINVRRKDRELRVGTALMIHLPIYKFPEHEPRASSLLFRAFPQYQREEGQIYDCLLDTTGCLYSTLRVQSSGLSMLALPLFAHRFIGKRLQYLERCCCANRLPQRLQAGRARTIIPTSCGRYHERKYVKSFVTECAALLFDWEIVAPAMISRGPFTPPSCHILMPHEGKSKLIQMETSEQR
jgi:hypothetical protein